MEFLGVGPLELLFIILLALIVLGPTDMVKAGRTIGRFLRKLVTSSTWQTVTQISRNLRYLPNVLMREAGLEEAEKEIKALRSDIPDQAEIGQMRDTKSLQEEIENASASMRADLSAWTTRVNAPPPSMPPQKPSSASPDFEDPAAGQSTSNEQQ